MVLFGDLIQKSMATKLITFETNGVKVFSRYQIKGDSEVEKTNKLHHS